MTDFKKCAVAPGTSVDLNKIDTAETFGWSKNKAQEQTQKNLARIAELQELLFAEKKRGLLIVLQAMDTGGKDGTIRTLGSGLNPAGTRVAAFKAPTEEEKKHDFLWRIEKQVPKKGEVVIFNRSHYEEVGIVRVHDMVPESVWRPRYDQINDFEAALAQPSADIPEGTHILKFFLHISKEEQWRRFRDRVETPEKQWKLSASDLPEREYWSDYMDAYSEAISQCSTGDAPWFVIPADNKWLRDLVISQTVVDYLEGLNMKFPAPSVDVNDIRRKLYADPDAQKAEKPKPAKSAKRHFNP